MGWKIESTDCWSRGSFKMHTTVGGGRVCTVSVTNCYGKYRGGECKILLVYNAKNLFQ